MNRMLTSPSTTPGPSKWLARRREGKKNTTAKNFFIALCSTRNRTSRLTGRGLCIMRRPAPDSGRSAPEVLLGFAIMLFGSSPANCAGLHGKGTMPTDVVMPQMGESIFEGTITKWLKKPGDKVQRDEPLFEISTDKVDAEIPAPASGVLRDIKVGEGNTVQVNTVVGTIAGDGEAAASTPSKTAAAPPPAKT